MHNINLPPPYIKDLIIKFLEKNATPTEIEILEDWLKQDESHRRQFDEINDTFQATLSLGRFTHQKTDRAWAALSEKLNAPKPDRTKTRSISLALKIAASILLLIAATTVLWNLLAVGNYDPKNLSVLQNATATKSKITLPDGSEVWLNTNSSVLYDADFGVTTRNVVLKGEAFFDVKKGKHDFIVSTNNLSIQVKGTRFNVITNDLSGNENTTLEEGRVVLKVNGNNTLYEMKPGDQIAFNKANNQVILQKVNPADYTAWKEDRLVFDNAPLANIIKKLENRYKATISIDANLAERERLTMTIENESLEEVLEFIELSSQLHYKKENNQITIF